MARYVPVAEVARPHGIRGELRLRLFNEGSQLLLERPSARLVFADGSERDVTISGARPTNKALLIKLSGVDDRDAAEALRGAKVSVPRAAFPPLDEGEFYACDIEGARVVLGGAEVGRVKGLENYPTCQALLVDRGAGGTFEVPLVEQYIASVDVERGVVELHTLEGLSG
jgi:16S rRNA processing protein RimM